MSNVPLNNGFEDTNWNRNIIEKIEQNTPTIPIPNQIFQIIVHLV